jgi:hypothetical protein
MFRALARQKVGVLPLALQSGDEENVRRISAFFMLVNQNEYIQNTTRDRELNKGQT